MNRSRLVIAIVAAVLVLAAVVLVPMLLGNDDEKSATAMAPHRYTPVGSFSLCR